MSFETAIQNVCRRFPEHGRFDLLPGESINLVVGREHVSKGRGVYVIFRRNDFSKPIYVGKAGSLQRGNSWKDQGIRGRLTAKQDGRSRSEYFHTLMQEECATGLSSLWFVTHDDISCKTLPALAEMELIQAYYDQFGDIPEKNKCI